MCISEGHNNCQLNVSHDTVDLNKMKNVYFI